MTRRFDYALFRDDRFVTNAMLTKAEAKALEAQGYRCLRPDATINTSLPHFRGTVPRGNSYVRQPGRNGRPWGH